MGGTTLGPACFELAQNRQHNKHSGDQSEHRDDGYALPMVTVLIEKGIVTGAFFFGHS